MNARKMAGGIVVLGAVAAAAIGIKMHLIHIPFLQKPKPVVLAAGTKASLVLADNISSGGTKEGQTVTFYVTQDVKVGTRVVLAKGTTVTAIVTHSRGATAVTSVLNQPARLSIEFKPVQTETGQTLAIGSAKGKEFEFTQENTANRKDTAKIDRLWETPEGKHDLETLKKGMTDGGPHPPDPNLLRKIADDVGMVKTKELFNNPRTNQPPDKMLQAVSQGDWVGLAGFDKVLALEALGELGSLTHAIDDHLRGVFKGNNIEAWAGLTLTVYTKEKLVLPNP